MGIFWLTSRVDYVLGMPGTVNQSRAHMELSPGWVLLGHVIQWCCENGRYEFDFMRGDEEYKYRFGGVNRFVMRARVKLARVAD